MQKNKTVKIVQLAHARFEISATNEWKPIPPTIPQEESNRDSSKEWLLKAIALCSKANETIPFFVRGNKKETALFLFAKKKKRFFKKTTKRIQANQKLSKRRNRSKHF